MSASLTRRNFLIHTGCIAGGAAVAAQSGAWAFAADGATKSKCLATCRDAITRPARQNNEDIWTTLKAVGSEGVEVAVAGDYSLGSLYHPTKKYTLATPAGVEEVAADAKAAGMRITGFCLGTHFEQQPDVEVAFCTRLAAIAQTLGVPAIRIDVVPHKLPRPEFLKVASGAIRKIIAATESTGVTFGVENHGNTTNDPVFTKALFDAVGSPRIGLTLDIGNFYWYGHPISKVYEFLEAFAPRVFHTHCKNIRYPADRRDVQRPMGWKYGECACPIDQGDIDYARVVSTLLKAGYHNDFCVENEFLGKTPGAAAAKTLAREIAFLKRLQQQA